MFVFQVIEKPGFIQKIPSPEKKFTEVNIYPNPIRASAMALSIRAKAEGKGHAKGGAVEVMNATGQRLWKRELRETEITNNPDGTNEVKVTVPCGMGGLNLKALVPGTYLVGVSLEYKEEKINTTREFRLIR